MLRVKEDRRCKWCYETSITRKETSNKFLPFNSLPYDKILDWSKLKAFADENFNITKTIISVCDKVENIAGKRENAGNHHFLLFLQCFQKLCFSGSLKLWIVW